MAQLKKREKILTTFAGGALVIFALNQFVCGESEPAKSETSRKVAVKKSTSVEPTKARDVQNRTPPRARNNKNRIRFASWGRDPFAEAYRLAKGDSTRRDSTDFVLRGVIWKGNQAHVLIGDAILKEGERKGDLKILRIEKNRVVCIKGRKVITLVLRDDEN